MSTGNCSSVGVVGAGIQGVCIGLQLLKKIYQQRYSTPAILRKGRPMAMPDIFRPTLYCN